jgi:pectin methylesterase-like acyl-CoA thioesterase
MNFHQYLQTALIRQRRKIALAAGLLLGSVSLMPASRVISAESFQSTASMKVLKPRDSVITQIRVGYRQSFAIPF